MAHCYRQYLLHRTYHCVDWVSRRKMAFSVASAGWQSPPHFEQARATVAEWNWLAPEQPAVAAFAPARLDVLGGIADYSGAVVLEMPLECGVVAFAQWTDDGMLSVRTGGPALPPLATDTATVPLALFDSATPWRIADKLRAALEAQNATWAAYALGPLAMLRAVGTFPSSSGLRLAMWSNVPAGAGVSSSAALEVATLRALQGLATPALDHLDGLRIASLAQQAEHKVALAPCGIMDQVTAALGERDHLLVLRCQPCDVLEQRPLPPDVRVFGIDTGHTHQVSGEQYGRVRAATFMGRTIIAARAAGRGWEDPPAGYLCNLKPERFLGEYAAELPEVMTGAEFLASYEGHGDTATKIEPDVAYNVRMCAAHPIFEQANVDIFLAALDRYEATGEMAALLKAGDAMYHSHESYSRRCGLGAPETDLVVALARERGAARGVFGAKITGGGGGGTVAVLTRGENAEELVAEIANVYSAQTGHPARVFARSEDGAMRWQPLQLASISDAPGSSS